MRVVLDNRDPVAFSNRKDSIHFAADTSVMNRNDSFRAWRYQAFELHFIDIQGIGANVAKNRARAA